MADPEDEEKKNEVDETPSAPESRATDTALQSPADKPGESNVYLPADKPWQNNADIPDDKPWLSVDEPPDDKPWEEIQTSPDDKPWEEIETIPDEKPAEFSSELADEGSEPEQPERTEPSQNQQASSPLQSAANKTPTDEATLHLQQLLDTVGDAGLRSTFTLPEPEQAPEPEPDVEPDSEDDPKSEAEPEHEPAAESPKKPGKTTRKKETKHQASEATEAPPPNSTTEPDDDTSALHWNLKKSTEPAPFDLKANTRKTHRTRHHKTARRPFAPAEPEDNETSSASSSLKNLAEALTDLNSQTAENEVTVAQPESLRDLVSALEAFSQEAEQESSDLLADTTDDASFEHGLPENFEDSNEIEGESTEIDLDEKQAEPDERPAEPGQRQGEFDELEERAPEDHDWKETDSPAAKPAPSPEVFMPASFEPDATFTSLKDASQIEELRQSNELLESLESSAREVELEIDPDDDYVGQEAIANKAQKWNIPLPEPHTAEGLAELSIMLPGDPDEAYNPISIGEFARSTGMNQDDLNSYFEIVFLKLSNPRLRQEAQEGLRFEVVSGKNANALKVLQELTAIEAAVNLKEAEQRNDAKRILQALCRLAFLEKGSKTAAEVLQGSQKRERGTAPHPLTDCARKAARYLRINKYEHAIKSFETFLLRNSELEIDELQAQRAEAVADIAAASKRMLKTLADDEYFLLWQKLESINAILVISETDKPKLAAEHLHSLRERQDSDKSAAGFLSYIEKQIESRPGIGRLADIEKDLSRGNMQPLRLLKECVPDLEDELNVLRLEQLKQELTPESSSAEFEESSRKLDNELRYGNEAASQELKWTRTGQTVRRISEAIQNRQLSDLQSVKAAAETIKIEMDRLCQLFYAKNSYARNALLGMLLHTAEPKILEHWRLTQERATLSPDLSLLSAKELSIISEHVALVFNEAQKANPDGFKLRPAEARGLANVLAKFGSIRERGVQKALEAIFTTAFKSRNKTVAVDGLLSGKAYEIPDYATFSSLIRQASAEGGLTSNQLKQLGSLAKQSVKAAISVLGSIARGALDSSLASYAAEQLLDAANIADNRKTLLKVLVQEYDREGDRAHLLAVVGEIASQEIHVDFKVIETLRVAFESSSKSPYSALYKSASRGFLRVAKNWQEREILTLSRNLRADILKSLPEIGPLLSTKSCDAFLEIQHEQLVKGKADDRLSAIQVVAALLKFASPALVRDLSRDLEFYSSSRGETELQRAGVAKDKIARFVESAKQALADIQNLPEEKRAELLKEPFVTPFEAREALDAAASVSGDSLHASSPGHRETRKMYERCIQTLLMSIPDAKKLISLPSEDRHIIESMLKDDDLSADTFSVLIKLEKEVISKLFSVPPRICSSILLPALAAGVLNKISMQATVQLVEPQRQATLDFIERAIDTSSLLSAVHFKAFIDLPQPAQIEFARAIRKDTYEGGRTLSPTEMMLALSSPLRNVSGRVLSDAAVLASSMQKNIINAEQLCAFAKQDDISRAGISGMLKAEVLDKNTAAAIFERVAKSEWTGANLRDLGVAALLGWLPEGFLPELMAEDLTLQSVVFERLSAEAPQGKAGEFSLQAFLKRLKNINAWLKKGVINKPGLHLLGKQHGSDILLMDLLQTQAEKEAEDRIAPESILQLIMQTRTNKLSAETLNTYRAALANNVLTRATFKTLLAQRPEQREAAELLLQYDSENFRQLAEQGLFRNMPAAAAGLHSPAHDVFPEAFPTNGKHEFADAEELNPEFKKVVSTFLELLNAGKAAEALQKLATQVASRELQTYSGMRMELSWKEAEIKFSNINSTEDLEKLRNKILEQNKESIAEDQESDFVPVAALDPVICILDHHKFRLRDAQNICEDGTWRASKQHEKAFLESVQKSAAAGAILTKIGQQLIQDWLSKEAEAKAKLAEDQKQKAVVIRDLCPGNFSSVTAEGKSQISFTNGMYAEIQLNPAAFIALEEAFNNYMAALRKASKTRGRRRESAMADLVKGFEKRIPLLLEACGVKLIRSTQTPYMIPIYHIELADDYRPPGASSKSEVIDLNLQQGLRRFLGEHASGKAIYDELARIKLSGITPKYDPCPPGRKPAAINPADQRSLSAKQRSALAAAILNDHSGLYQGCHKQQFDEPVKTDLEICVFKPGSGRNNAEEAFDRAEQWAHLMFFLNDFQPVSQGGNTISELYDAGEFNDLHCDRETLLLENDFIQMMLEFGIVPEKSLLEVHGYYRQEIDDRLKKDPAEFITEFGLIEIAEAEDFTASEIFSRGEAVTYNDEDYRIIAREAGKVLIKYEGQAREPAPASPRQLSDMELETKFTPVQANNKIHFLSNSANDPGIYVLTCNEKGQKLLHYDSSLRFVPAELLAAAEKSGRAPRAGRELSFAPDHLAASARKLFDTFKEYGIVIGGQGIALSTKQEIIGSGTDAGIKVADEKNQVAGRHLQLLVTGDTVSIQDLHSANGTFLNWKRLRPYETVALRTCDQVNLGAVDGLELSLFCKPKESSTGRNHKVMVGSKTLTADRALTIGRLPSADVYVSFPSVSRIQATIRMNSEGKIIIKDGSSQVPSASGIVINGRQVIPGAELELRPGDLVSTRTGVELPIRFVEKNKLNLDLNAEKTMGRFSIKNSSLKEMLAGVDGQHGVYALAHRIKARLKQVRLDLVASKSIEPAGKKYLLKKRSEGITLQSQKTQEKLQDYDRKPGKPILCARGPMSDAALKQSNDHADSMPIAARFEDGWSNAGKGIKLDKNGKFTLANRIATSVNRSQDHVLRGVIEDAKRRFGSLPPETRAEALTEYARELLTPKDLTPDQLDQWYDQFCQDHDGKRVLLGEFIKEGKGVSTQQAALLKVLADEFADLPCTLVRGMDGNHSWTTFNFDGIEHIHDPRGRFISAVAGTENASPRAKLWVPDPPDSKSFSFKTELKLGSLVSFDATSGWRVIGIETHSDEIIIGATGCRFVSSADLTLANPERALLVIGERYNIPRPDGLLDQGLSAWILQSITRDGNLRMVKPGSIQIRVRKDQVRPRSMK